MTETAVWIAYLFCSRSLSLRSPTTRRVCKMGEGQRSLRPGIIASSVLRFGLSARGGAIGTKLFLAP